MSAPPAVAVVAVKCRSSCRWQSSPTRRLTLVKACESACGASGSPPVGWLERMCGSAMSRTSAASAYPRWKSHRPGAGSALSHCALHRSDISSPEGPRVAYLEFVGQGLGQTAIREVLTLEHPVEALARVAQPAEQRTPNRSVAVSRVSCSHERAGQGGWRVRCITLNHAQSHPVVGQK